MVFFVPGNGFLSNHKSFFCPLHTQRYHHALRYIQEINPYYVLDLGCADCDFIFYLSRNPGNLQFIVGADKDLRALQKGSNYLSAPQVFYSNSRSFPIFLFNQDVTNFSNDFVHQNLCCPFITMLELMEHLEPNDLELALYQIFHRICPFCIYITTPNIEYNDILTKSFGHDRRFGKFRHKDHKFELNRTEFYCWCSWVCENYGYSVNIDGVGKCVDGNDDGNCGCASHSAFFLRSLPVYRNFFSYPNNSTFSVIIQLNDEQCKEAQ